MESLISTTDVEAEDLFDRLIQYFKTTNFWISLAIIIVAIIVWQVIKQARKNYFKKNKDHMSTASHVAFDLGRAIFIFAVVIALMQLNGVNVTGLITGLGIVSVIVGLALQDFLKDIIMGAHILTDKFFQVGDVVRYVTAEGKEIEGEVISFNIRTTKIQLIDYAEVMTISNRNIDEIIVLADYFDLDVDIPYHVEPKKVHEAMKKICEKLPGIGGVEKVLYKGTERFKESAVTYRIRYWTDPGRTRQDVRRAVTTMVQNGMIEAGVPFAYNHLDVELVTEVNKIAD